MRFTTYLFQNQYISLDPAKIIPVITRYEFCTNIFLTSQISDGKKSHFHLLLRHTVYYLHRETKLFKDTVKTLNLC